MSDRITFRILNKEDKENYNKLLKQVEQKKFKNQSHAIRTAIKLFVNME